jgi:uncharacterized protein
VVTVDERIRSVLWRRRDVPGTEWCELNVGAAAKAMHGVIAMAWDGQPWRIEYAIELDTAGLTRTVTIDANGGSSTVSLSLHADGQGRWRRGEAIVVDSPDALDVDLGFSPATNTLPIRRLGLAIGESAEIGVAWVLFPSFEVEYGRQRYTRLGERRWRYQSIGFEAELTIDEDGLVEDYAEWEAVARS